MLRSQLCTVSTVLLIYFAAGCSNDKTITIAGPGEPAETVVPGDTLPIDTTAAVDGSGNYVLPEDAVRLSWRCTGSASVEVQSTSGSSSQTCLDSQQSVTVQSPGTVTVELGENASLVILAASS